MMLSYDGFKYNAYVCSSSFFKLVERILSPHLIYLNKKYIPKLTGYKIKLGNLKNKSIYANLILD